MLGRIGLFGLLSTLLLVQGTAWAQEAPAPRKMPRLPVLRQTVAETKTTPSVPRSATGIATILDTERLRVGDVEVRLFGIIPPQLSASFGPQTRVALDGLSATGETTCAIRDRNREGHLLAICTNANKGDLALGLLKRGLATTARGSLKGTEIESSYTAAEQAAQAQKLGLWSIVPPSAVTDSSIRNISVRNEVIKAALAEPATKDSANKNEAKAEEPPATEPKTEKVEKTELAAPEPKKKTQETGPQKDTKEAPPPLVISAPLEKFTQVVPLGNTTENAVSVPEKKDFFSRYQLLMTGVMMLLTAFGVMGALVFQRRTEKREELRSIAAALRGELMAARGVCQARLNIMRTDTESKRNTPWPRVRALLFQAYVSQLGRLGADLARQVASIYGQASDYASYYNALNPTEAQALAFSKRQALQTLVEHIEEVLPRLAQIEISGLPVGPAQPQTRVKLNHFMKTMATTAAPETPIIQATEEKSEKHESAPEETATEEIEPEVETLHSPESLEQETASILSEVAPPHAPEKIQETKQKETAAPRTEAPSAKPEQSPARKQKTAEQAAPLWGAIKKFATERHFENRNNRDSMEDLFPDYANMTEEEMEALAYSASLEDDDYLLTTKGRQH